MDWATAFWPITREPKFCQLWTDDEISITILASILNSNISFHSRFFQKIQKSLGYFGPFFSKPVQKSIFVEKRALPVFKYSNDLLSCNISIYIYIKIISHSWEKCQTDRWTYMQAESDFIGQSVERDPKKNFMASFYGWRSTSQVYRATKRRQFNF